MLHQEMVTVNGWYEGEGGGGLLGDWGNKGSVKSGIIRGDGERLLSTFDPTFS